MRIKSSQCKYVLNFQNVLCQIHLNEDGNKTDSTGQTIEAVQALEDPVEPFKDTEALAQFLPVLDTTGLTGRLLLFILKNSPSHTSGIRAKNHNF